MPRAGRPAGLTLVETALLISLLGAFLAAFLPTFVRELRTSKIAEASEQLQRLHLATAAYWSSAQKLPDGRTARHCLPPAAGPTPSELSPYAYVEDFTDPEVSGHETWKALGFAPSRPLRFRYTFLPSATGCGVRPVGDGPLVVYRAEADLDGDGDISVFELAASPDEDDHLVLTGILEVESRSE